MNPEAAELSRFIGACIMFFHMECHCLRSSELPHTTELYRAYLEDFSRVTKFYAHPPTDKGIRAAAREVQLDPQVRRAVVDVLREQNRYFGADGSTERNLQRLAAGAVAVVTGQQVGLFSGPCFSFYKALTAIRLAKTLTEGGLDAVPVFWLASEDHDLAEVNHCYWLGQGGALLRLEVPIEEQAAGRSAGHVALGAKLSAALKPAVHSLEGAAAETVARALEESYRPEENYGSAFGKLMARLLGGRGVILLDSLDVRLHRLAAPVFRRAFDEHAALTKDLLAREKALEKARFHAQVKVTERSTLLFRQVEGRRVALRARNRDFAAGAASYSLEELQGSIEIRPEDFSANVLLRPIMQDALLPTAAYVGGPAEVAYFAQCEVVYRRLLGRMPAIVPRAGFTLVEPHLARLLPRYALDIRDVLHGRQYLRKKMELQALPKALARQFTASEKSIRALLKKLRRPLSKLDRTLAGALDTAERKMLYQFLKLRAKAGRSESFRTGVLDRHERALLDALHPHHGIQERALCLLPFLARHGLGLLDELEGRAAANAAQHQVLFL